MPKHIEEKGKVVKRMKQKHPTLSTSMHCVWFSYQHSLLRYQLPPRPQPISKMVHAGFVFPQLG